MRLDPGARADPDALQRIAVAQLDPVRFVEPVEMRRNIDRRQIDGARLAQFLRLVDTAEDVGELARPDPDIPPHLGVDRKGVVYGMSVLIRVDLWGRAFFKKNK